LYLEVYHSILLPNLYLLAFITIFLSVDVMKYLQLKEHLSHIVNSFGSGEFVRFARN
jgi:ABC-type enterochelin transport system permease subunit